MLVTKSNTTRDELRTLKDTDMLKWSEIMEIPKFKGIPKRTLSMIYLGKRDVPKKYRSQVGEPEMELARVCPIHGIVETYDCQKQVVKAKREKKPREYKDLFSMPKNVLLWKLENRKAVE